MIQLKSMTPYPDLLRLWTLTVMVVCDWSIKIWIIAKCAKPVNCIVNRLVCTLEAISQSINKLVSSKIPLVVTVIHQQQIIFEWLEKFSKRVFLNSSSTYYQINS